MPPLNDVLRSLTIVGATVAGVAAVTLGLVGLIVPRPADGVLNASAEPTFDLAIAPDRVGGSLEVSGDRTGTLRLDRGSADVRYEPAGAVPELILGDLWLTGEDGQIRFSRDPAKGVSQVQYDGLSFFLDPGDCTITPGAHNAAAGLMSALLECLEIADVRDAGVISIEGVVALPADVLGDRGDLPPSGGSIDVGDTTVDFSEAGVLLDGGVDAETGRMQMGLFNDDEEYLVIEYDPETAEYFLIAIQIADEYAFLSEACPVAAEDLGRLNPQTTVVRFTIDCDGVDLPGGGFGTVSGSVVADIIESAVEIVPDR